MSVSPTRNQYRVLLYISGFREHFGRAPTCAEIARGCALHNKAHAHAYLTSLEERGHVLRPFKLARDLFLLSKPPIPRAPDGAPLHFVALG